jgi:hypothetical protein
MITREQAIELGAKRHGTLHHTTLKNADGSPVRCRVNGKCKVWKRQPSAFRLPVKHGLKFCFYIEQHNAHEWSVV